jgi:hypothetical protein
MPAERICVAMANTRTMDDFEVIFFELFKPARVLTDWFRSPLEPGQC